MSAEQRAELQDLHTDYEIVCELLFKMLDSLNDKYGPAIFSAPEVAPALAYIVERAAHWRRQKPEIYAPQQTQPTPSE